MTIEERMFLLPENLKHIGLALVQFVYTFEKGKFEQATPKGEWIYQPNNFVAFNVQRGPVISMHITNDYYPHDFAEKDIRILPLVKGHWKPRCIIEGPQHLAIAARYIEVSHQRHGPKTQKGN